DSAALSSHSSLGSADSADELAHSAGESPTRRTSWHTQPANRRLGGLVGPLEPRNRRRSRSVGPPGPIRPRTAQGNGRPPSKPGIGNGRPPSPPGNGNGNPPQPMNAAKSSPQHTVGI